MARNYQHEAAIEDPKRKAERAARNRARRKLVNAGHAMAGKQAEHKNGVATDNRLSNLKPVSPKANNNGRAGGPAKRGK